MESKSVSFYNELKKAALDSDQVLFEEILKKRVDYIESIPSTTEKKEVLTYFIEKDKELAIIFTTKKDGIQQLLVTQNNQLNAAKKYNQF